MRAVVIVTTCVLGLGLVNPAPAQAQPGGCLKYGLGGAIIGHFAGGHRLKGAALGCALGIIRRRYETNTQYNERIRREELRQRREHEEDVIARRQRRGDDALARRRGQNDEEVLTRRSRRGLDPDETGATGQQERRGRETVF